MRIRMRSIGISASMVIAVMATVSLVACAPDGPVPARDDSPQAAVATGTPFATSGTMMEGEEWWESTDAVSHEEALDKIDYRLSLPATSVVGTIVRVSTGWMPESDEGTRGARILYSSGVELSVRQRETPLFVMTEFNPFTDKRKTASVLQSVDGTRVLVTEPGVQLSSHGENRVPAMLIWNAGGMQYMMRSSEENQSTEFLKRVMRTMVPAGEDA